MSDLGGRLRGVAGPEWVLSTTPGYEECKWCVAMRKVGSGPIITQDRPHDPDCLGNLLREAADALSGKPTILHDKRKLDV